MILRFLGELLIIFLIGMVVGSLGVLWLRRRIKNRNRYTRKG